MTEHDPIRIEYEAGKYTVVEEMTWEPASGANVEATFIYQEVWKRDWRTLWLTKRLATTPIGWFTK